MNHFYNEIKAPKMFQGISVGIKKQTNKKKMVFYRMHLDVSNIHGEFLWHFFKWDK